MEVLEYHNHPSYDPKNILNGYDISVYKVNDRILRVRTFKQYNIKNNFNYKFIVYIYLH